MRPAGCQREHNVRRSSSSTWLKITLLSIALALTCSNQSVDSSISKQAPSPQSIQCGDFVPRHLPPREPVPQPIYGVTIENAEDHFDRRQNDLVKALQLSQKPTVRLIFNGWSLEDELPTYKNIAQTIRPQSYIMGEILDSSAVKLFSVNCYKYRTAKYVDAITDIDIWEIGNEVNGGWLRRNEDVWSDTEAAEVQEKIVGAYQVVKDAGGKTALTLYYNDDHHGNHCWQFKQEEMFAWTRRYIPETMRNGLDYVLISFYEDDPGKDCRNQQSQDGEDRQFDKKRLKGWQKKPLNPDWLTVFQDLATIFPNAKLGFGECGTKPESKKRVQLTKYYKVINGQLREGLPPDLQSRYVGGYFWWYFKQDMVPADKKLWIYFDDLIKPAPAPPSVP
jgi:hypothetical protein